MNLHITQKVTKLKFSFSKDGDRAFYQNRTLYVNLNSFLNMI